MAVTPSDDASILDLIVAAIELREGTLAIASSDPTRDAMQISLPIDAADRSRLAAFLYANYYAYDPSLCQQRATDYLTLLGLRVSDPTFVDELRRANPGTGYYTADWRVTERVEDGGLLVAKEGITLLVRPEEHLRPDARDAGPGDVVEVRFPADSAMGAPGFYLAFSDAGPANGDDLVRVYLHLRAKDAVAISGALLARLHALGHPYTYKVLADPARYGRRDTAVLYVARVHLEAALDAVRAVHDQRPHAFVAAVPSFTLRIRDGVGVADNPAGTTGDEVSFGEHRTGLVADAICECFAEPTGEPVSRDRLRRAVEDHLRGAGVTPDALHRVSNPPSTAPRSTAP